MTTKTQQILDPQSAWNQAHNDEPVLVIRAWQWRAIMRLAQIVDFNRMFYEDAMEMKRYSNDNDIPF